PAWATELFQQAEQLAEWQQLKARCASNGFAAGLATEAVLRSVMDLLPQQPPEDGEDEGHRPFPGGASSPDDGDARRKLRQACRDATKSVDEAEASLEGLTEAFGLHAGTEPGQVQTLHDIDQVRQLYALVRDNPMLRQIAELAGRLQRLGSTHKRTQVT